MLNKGKAVAAALAITVAYAPMMAFAQSTLTHEELLRRIEQLEAQNQELKALVTESMKQSEETAAKVDEVAESRPVISGTQGFGLETPDGDWSVNLRGRVMADYGYIDDSEDLYDGDAAELRRARLGIEGKAGGSNVRYRFEFDAGDGDADVTDARVQLRGELVGKDRITFGQFKTPNSLTEQTSSRFVGFMERPAFTDAFGFDRQIGVGVRNQLGDFRADYGLFFGNFGNDIGGDEATDEGLTAAVRGVYTPKNLLAEGDAVHAGASYRFREDGESGSDDLIEYDADLPIQLGGADFVQVGEIADSDHFVGAELAYGVGAAHVGFDGGVLFAQCADEAADCDGEDFATFYGGAVEAGYWLTGESNRVGGGAIGGRPRVLNPIYDGGWGAFQLVGRADYIDLSGGDANTNGGQAYQLTGGLNWWLTPHVLLQTNVFYANIQDGFGDASDATGDNGENDVVGVGLRAQVDW